MSDTVTSGDDFGVEVSTAEHGRVLTVRGEIDIASARRLWEAIQRNLDGGPDVFLDLGGVTFLDSAGLALIIRANQLLARQGGQLRLRNIPRPAARAMEVAGIARLFADEADAQPEPRAPS